MDLEDSAERLRQRWGIAASSLQPHHKSFAERILAVLEHPLFLTVFSIVGGILGVFLASWFALILDACILMAIHRSGSVSDIRSSRIRFGVFLVAFLVCGALLMWAAVAVRSNAKEAVGYLAESVVEKMHNWETRSAIKPDVKPDHSGSVSTLMPTPTAHPRTVPSLKVRTLALSSEISKMLGERKRSEPEPTHRYLSETTEQDKNRIWLIEGREWTEAISRHNNETLAQYQERFAPQVASLVTELIASGIDVGELSKEIKYTIPVELPSIASNLASCAARLPR